MIKKHIPNFITCLNLFAGSVAVYYGFQGDYTAVLILVLIAAIMDFLDGFAARLLHAYSPMGKEMDSLADVISFGLAPGVVAFSLLSESGLPLWASFFGFITPVFSALRLAKFNIDERQSNSFIGLPTPANALFWVGLAYSYSHFVIANNWIIFALLIVFSGLLVAEVPMFSLKFKNFGWATNKLQYSFLIGCILILAILRLDAFSAVISWYIALSVTLNLFPKKHQQ